MRGYRHHRLNDAHDVMDGRTAASLNRSFSRHGGKAQAALTPAKMSALHGRPFPAASGLDAASR